MNLQNFTYNMNPFVPMGSSPFHHTAPAPQMNNMYYNPPAPSYTPDYNSPNRHQTQHYNRIEPYQKPSGYSNPAGSADPEPYSSQGKVPQSNYPYYQQNAPPYPAPNPSKEPQYPSAPVPSPPQPSNKRIAPPPASPPSTTARPQYTRVEGSSGSKTSVHAILDYDDDFEDYYDEETPHDYKYNHVTPIQGPITIKNNSIPVVPLYSYDTINNGSLLQIPILWTALSVALGYEVKGDFIRGPPCIKRNHQLYCPTAGSTYPINKIEKFIDDNKALMRRMYGEFSMSPDYGPPQSQQGYSNPRNRKRHIHDGADYIDDILLPEQNKGKRKTRQSLPSTNKDDTGRMDACESKIDIVTPYWASNSAGKVRAIVNTEHFEQAIHQEVCTKTKTGRCAADCGCEQKYKWHRLLAYDPDNDCKGIFMDWFLFPSCCVCRCNPPATK